MDVLQQWIENTNFERLRMEVIFFDMHYKYANLLTLGDLKAIIDGDPNTNQLLMNNVSSVDDGIYVTTYSYVGECEVWKGLDWEQCLFTDLFNYKVYFQVIIYV
jgi:hypothetical protein